MEWNRESWSKEDYSFFQKELEQVREKNFQIFQQKLIPGIKTILGVRIPWMKSVAKQIAKGNWKHFLEQAEENSFEEIMIQGFVIAFAKTDSDTLLELTKEFIPKIDNWAVCDCFCSALKGVKKAKEPFWHLIQHYSCSEKEFEVRFSIVLGMDYFMEESYLQELFQMYRSIRHEGYYVKMAVAWAVSLCFVKFQKETCSFLEENSLDYETSQKALQKILDSGRVDLNTKEKIRMMKRKKRELQNG